MTIQTAEQTIAQALKFYAATESYASANSIPDVMRDCGQRAKEALALAGWQPLETAPKSPTPEGHFQRVLLRGISTGRSFSHAAVTDGWVGHDGKPEHCYSYKLRITHWMSLPADPEAR